MEEKLVKLSGKNVRYLFNEDLHSWLKKLQKKIVVITDDNILALHNDKFQDFEVISFPAGEAHKKQGTADDIIEKMLALNIDKDAVVAGVGGGVVTDLAGYVASIYKRGVALVQVPTSILAMCDAAIGGKNGVNSAHFKNMIGTIYQPQAVLFDFSLLATLPETEWINGFAEIIKHACIKDALLFKELEKNSIDYYRNNLEKTAKLIRKNVDIKSAIVVKDEFEKGDRMLLNFGHTLGHAIEQQLKIPHGNAISIGMAAACKISEEINNLYSEERVKVEKLLLQYGLPVRAEYEKEDLWEAILSDKKRKSSEMNFILLNKIGEGEVMRIPLIQLQDLIEQIL